VASLDQENCESSVVDMAAAVARQCLAKAVVEPRDVDVLIYCGIYREKLLSEPAVAALVLGQLGIESTEPGRRYSKLAFDIADGALGFLTACHCAAQLIDAGRARRVLVAAAELPGNPSVSFRGADRLIPTASAALLTRSDHIGGRFDSFAFETSGERASLRTSCCRHTNGSPSILVNEDSGFHPQVQSSSVELLEKYRKKQQGGADWLLALPPLGSDPLAAAALAQTAGVPRGRVVTVPGANGDLFTSSLAFAWQALERRPDCLPGQRVLAIQAASGLRVGCFSYVLAGRATESLRR
jgi:3-oxoacyl-[acyl-carrier-protein] synthase III